MCIRDRDSILIGASGAIFGVLGAFAFIYPFKKVVIPLMMPIIIFVRLPVIAIAIIYATMETLYTVAGVTDGIAHSAHLGGFIGGVILSSFLVRKKVMEEKKIVWNEIEKYLKDEREREILRRARDADIEEVRDAWLSYLMKCPKCGGELKIKDGLVCPRCGYRK